MFLKDVLSLCWWWCLCKCYVQHKKTIFLRLMVINSSLWITFLFVDNLMSVSLFNAVKIFIIVLEYPVNGEWLSEIIKKFCLRVEFYNFLWASLYIGVNGWQFYSEWVEGWACFVILSLHISCPELQYHDTQIHSFFHFILL